MPTVLSFCTILTAAGLLAGGADAAVPAYDIPGPADAARFVSGHNVRIGIIHDSISFPTFGEAGGVNHTPMIAGMIRNFAFAEGFRGLFCPPGSYTTASGIFSAIYTSPSPQGCVAESQGGVLADGYLGLPDLNAFVPQLALQLRFPSAAAASGGVLMQFGLVNPGGPPGPLIYDTRVGNTASAALIAAPSLTARLFILRDPRAPIVNRVGADLLDQSNSPLNPRLADVVVPNTGQGTDWLGADFPLNQGLAGFNPSATSPVLRVRLFDRAGLLDGAYLTTMGCLFFNPDSSGALIVPIAGGGGWNTDHHIISTPGPNGYGYTAAGLRAKYKALGFGDNSAFRVLVIALGTNVAAGEANGALTTDVYKANLLRVMQDHLDAVAAIGGSVQRILLVAPHSWTLSPDLFATSRAEKLWEIHRDRADTWFVNLPAMLGQRGAGFDSTWYFHQPDALTTSAASPGAVSVAVNDPSRFPASGAAWIGDSLNSDTFVYTGRGPASLTGVTPLAHAYGPGARVLSDSGVDLHLSLAGSDRIARAIWDAIAASVPPGCPGDADGNNAVNFADFTAVMANWGTPAPTPNLGGDANSDGQVTFADLTAVFANWGATCP